MHRTLLLLLAALAGCSDGSRDVVVRVAVPGLDSIVAPVPGAQVLALPYDRDSVREALGAAASAERPRAAEAELDSLFGVFRAPFGAFVQASDAAAKLADTVAALEERGAAGVELTAARARLIAAQRDQERARAELDELRRSGGDRMDSLRTVVQRWENSAYADWSAEVEQLARGGRTPRADTTGPRGVAQLRVPGGDWWIHAAVHDPLDPNARWYWNVPLEAGTDTVTLDAQTGVRRPRY